jgi:undecaprenyl diphosphate synthase
MDANPAPDGTRPPPPQHVAIIMDGNGRWAKQRGLPRIAGHRKGAEAVRAAVRGAHQLGIRYLTLFGFSSENWNRPEAEVRDLMGLLRRYLQSEIADLHRNGVRIRFIGERARLSKDLTALIENAEHQTAGNSGLVLTVALSYGGRGEIVSATRAIARQVADGTLSLEQIDEATFASGLYTADMPDPDVLIRTSGERRISNFLLWQIAYAELVFLDQYWPDFNEVTLADAIEEFHRRDRRYGASVG